MQVFEDGGVRALRARADAAAGGRALARLAHAVARAPDAGARAPRRCRRRGRRPRPPRRARRDRGGRMADPLRLAAAAGHPRAAAQRWRSSACACCSRDTPAERDGGLPHGHRPAWWSSLVGQHRRARALPRRRSATPVRGRRRVRRPGCASTTSRSRWCCSSTASRSRSRCSRPCSRRSSRASRAPTCTRSRGSSASSCCSACSPPARSSSRWPARSSCSSPAGS